MKKLLFVALVATLLISCKDNIIDGYVITGTIDNIENGERVYIELPPDENQLEFMKIDSAEVKNGKFRFIGLTDDIQIAFVHIGDNKGRVSFILENQPIEMTVYMDSIHKSTVGGSYNNKEFNTFNRKFEAFKTQVALFQRDNLGAMMTARQLNDAEAVEKISKEYEEIEGAFNNYVEQYIADNSNSIVSVLLMLGKISDPEADKDKLESNFNKLSSEMKSTKLGKILEEGLFQEVQQVERQFLDLGDIAPNFSAPDPHGKMVSLKESMGKVTLIDFWASWCGPCRVENPNVVALYNDFHDKGLNIIGVSLDRADQKDKWLEAVATDKLTWTQVSNLQHWNDPIAKTYNVEGIPATFLLDAEGKIIAKNLRGAELRAKVAEVLAE